MGWRQLLEIVAEQRRDVEEENTRREVACPNDGTVLEDVNGVLHCPMGDYTNPPMALIERRWER